MNKKKVNKKIFWILAAILLILITFLPSVLSDFILPPLGGGMVHSDPQMSENIRLPVPTENVNELWRCNDLMGEKFGTFFNGISGNGKIAASTFINPGGRDNLILYDYYGNHLWSSGKWKDWSLNMWAMISTPMVDINNRVIACDNEKIIMVNASDLDTINVTWITEIISENASDDPVPISPTIVENKTIILPTKDGPIFAYDVETGSEKAQIKLGLNEDIDPYWGIPYMNLSNARKVMNDYYFCSICPYYFNTTSQLVEWNSTVEYGIMQRLRILYFRFIDDNITFYALKNGSVVAIDSETDETLACNLIENPGIQTGEGFFSTVNSACVKGNRVFLVTGYTKPGFLSFFNSTIGRLYAIDVVRDDENNTVDLVEAWNYTYFGSSQASPILIDDTVFFDGYNNTVFVDNRDPHIYAVYTNGTERWNVSYDNMTWFSFAVDPRGGFWYEDCDQWPHRPSAFKGGNKLVRFSEENGSKLEEINITELFDETCFLPLLPSSCMTIGGTEENPIMLISANKRFGLPGKWVGAINLSDNNSLIWKFKVESLFSHNYVGGQYTIMRENNVSRILTSLMFPGGGVIGIGSYSNCWFTNNSISYLAWDTDDADTDNDSVNITFTIKNRIPDKVTVKALLINRDHPHLFRYIKEETYTITNNSTITDTITVKPGHWGTDGDYFVHLYLFNSSGNFYHQNKFLDEYKIITRFYNDSDQSDYFYLKPTNAKPEIPSTPDGPNEIEAFKSATYNTTTSDANTNDKIWYMWDWRANKIIHEYTKSWIPCESEEIHSKSHIWAIKDDYQIRVKARDNCYNPFSWTDWSPPKIVTVPTGVNIFYGSATVLLNQEIDLEAIQEGFDDQSEDQIDYNWSLGNGDNASGQNISYSYNQTGNYTVNLTVNQKEEYANCSISIEVVSLLSDFNASSLYIKPYETVYFNDASEGIFNITNWSWNVSGYTSNDQNTSYMFTEEGIYNVELEVMDSNETTHISSQKIYVDETPPTIYYVYNTPVLADINDTISIFAYFGDNCSGLYNASVNISYADGSYNNYSMNISDETTKFDHWIDFNDTSEKGVYFYTIWVCDQSGNMNHSSGFNFFIIAPSLGYNRQGEYFQSVEDRLTGCIFKSYDGCYVNNISAYVYGNQSSPQPRYKCMIYDADNMSLIASTEEKQPVETGWVTFNVTGNYPLLNIDTDYIIAICGENTSYISYDYDSDVFGIGGIYQPLDFSSSNPDPADFVDKTETRVYSIYCSYSYENVTPVISNVSADLDIVGFGGNVTLSALVVDNQSTVSNVWVTITNPENTSENYTMSSSGDNLYEYVFNDSWIVGQYNFSVWASDQYNNTNSSSGYSFNVSGQATINVATLKDTYGAGEYINITDPPTVPENYILTSRGLDYNKYYNAVSGNDILEVYTGPVNYQDENEEWTPINETIETLDSNHPAYNYGYRAGNQKGLYSTYFKPNIQSDWPVAFAYSKSDNPTTHVIRSKLVGLGYLDPSSGWDYEYLQSVQPSQGEIEDSSVVYEDVFTGADVKWSYGTTGLKEDIILYEDARSVLENHPPSDFGLSNADSYLVFITQLDYQGLKPYNISGDLIGNVTITENGIDFKDALGYFKCALPLGEAYEFNNESNRRQLIYRIIQYDGNCYLLSGLKIADLNNMTFPVVVDPTLTVYSTVSDGYIYRYNHLNYNTAWTSSTGTVYDSSNAFYIGQKRTPLYPFGYTYHIYRGYLYFNTASLPSNADITNATVSLTKSTDYSDTDFDIVIQNGQPTYPHDPLVSGDYAKGYYSGDGGSFNTADFSSGSNDISLTNYSLLTKEGMTKLCLRSSRDISGTSPNGNEYVTVRSANWVGTAYDPKLVIEYSNQSKIKNTGSTNISGYLYMTVEYNNDSTWELDVIAVNETIPSTINVGEQLALDQFFNGNVNTDDLTYGGGTYRVYAAFRDYDGEVLMTDDEELLEDWYEFTVSFIGGKE